MPRIVGGAAKGRRLKAPHDGVRPATARARQALFDYLAQVIPGANVLDLYCGSGGLGIEALSRGAAHVHFVDISHKSLHYARENVALCGFDDRAWFTLKDVYRFLHQCREEGTGPFDLIFAAPPYRQAEPERILDEVVASEVLNTGGLICLEYSRHTAAPRMEESSPLTLDRRKVYGESVVEVWERVR
ncbi:MAG: 16S rRNA (guanine(966)-N(2))-methyltransferase RsmD [Calditrichaeota bacterium]|nr:16S rRNA (guanine(966)-N(2))-methyltransferase RsmD [Calditrichota bacterium]